MKIEYKKRGMGFPMAGDLLADFDNELIYRVLPDTEGTGNIQTHGPGMPNTIMLNVDVVECVGWTGKEGESEGYNVWHYFDDDGTYNGPDLFGVEPVFEAAGPQEPLCAYCGATPAHMVRYEEEGSPSYSHYLCADCDDREIKELEN